jgi:hypothetical protein
LDAPTSTTRPLASTVMPSTESTTPVEVRAQMGLPVRPYLATTDPFPHL